MTSYIVVCNDAEYFLRHRTPAVERLVAQGSTVTVVTGGRQITDDERQGWSHRFVPMERFSLKPIQDLMLSWLTFKLCRSQRPDAVHLITLKPALFSGLAALCARAIVGHPQRVLITIPGLGRLMSPSSTERHWQADASRWFVKRAIKFLSSRKAVTFTFETSHDRSRWLDDGLVKQSNSVVICGAGVDPEAFFPRPSAEPGNRPLRILFASRLLRSKGLDVFVQVARRLSDRRACHFIVAGMVEEHDPDGYSVQQLSREPAIEFLGEIRDMPNLLRSVDIVCLPTRYGEGIPRILIEASATGLPCIATDLAGCREILRHGQTGVLFPIGSEEEMIEALSAAVTGYTSDPALVARHGQAALELFRAGEFSEASVVSHFVSLLTEKT